MIANGILRGVKNTRNPLCWGLSLENDRGANYPCCVWSDRTRLQSLGSSREVCGREIRTRSSRHWPARFARFNLTADQLLNERNERQPRAASKQSKSGYRYQRKLCHLVILHCDLRLTLSWTGLPTQAIWRVPSISGAISVCPRVWTGAMLQASMISRGRADETDTVYCSNTRGCCICLRS